MSWRTVGKPNQQQCRLAVDFGGRCSSFVFNSVRLNFTTRLLFTFQKTKSDLSTTPITQKKPLDIQRSLHTDSDIVCATNTDPQTATDHRDLSRFAKTAASTRSQAHPEPSRNTNGRTGSRPDLGRSEGVQAVGSDNAHPAVGAIKECDVVAVVAAGGATKRRPRGGDCQKSPSLLSRHRGGGVGELRSHVDR